MVNKLLEDNGFYSPAEKLIGTGFLAIIGVGTTLLILILVMFFVFIPYIACGITVTILCFYLYFKGSKYTCPLCLERIEDFHDDGVELEERGVFIHEWCQNLLEEKHETHTR